MKIYNESGLYIDQRTGALKDFLRGCVYYSAAVSCVAGVYRLGGVGLGSGSLGQRASGAVHGSVHGWCIGAWW